MSNGQADLAEIAESADAALGIAQRALESEIADVHSQIDALHERTEFLQAVQKASNLKPEERAVVCIQTLYNEASNCGPQLAEMEVRGTITALGESVKRHHIYPVFDTTDDLAEAPDSNVDGSVLSVVREDGAARTTRGSC
ncbi:hypothetical protein [Halobacterium jilantaiense]|uniref:Uncharacterized protein n=1 Tax=Halobacterium jilantaiense TaxID=355548 RepID=A0A1I0MKX0_9EURY|nr:hypothetical protein [Halobacterium jilantaiense]SEV88191.1 hypothetical protein SAMN04487945_0102 [Halobacterium jilantaiense]